MLDSIPEDSQEKKLKNAQFLYVKRSIRHGMFDGTQTTDVNEWLAWSFYTIGHVAVAVYYHEFRTTKRFYQSMHKKYEYIILITIWISMLTICLAKS